MKAAETSPTKKESRTSIAKKPTAKLLLPVTHVPTVRVETARTAAEEIEADAVEGIVAEAAAVVAARAAAVIAVRVAVEEIAATAKRS